MINGGCCELLEYDPTVHALRSDLLSCEQERDFFKGRILALLELGIADALGLSISEMEAEILQLKADQIIPIEDLPPLP